MTDPPASRLLALQLARHRDEAARWAREIDACLVEVRQVLGQTPGSGEDVTVALSAATRMSRYAADLVAALASHQAARDVAAITAGEQPGADPGERRDQAG